LRLVYSRSESPHYCGRELYRDEQIGRVDVVLARFVDNAKIAFPRCFAVGEYLVQLSDLEVLHAAIFYAQRERTSRLLNSHADQSRKRLIFSPLLPTP
jgi:hypothetical protein